VPIGGGHPDPWAHLLRHRLDFVSYEDHGAVAAALEDICRVMDVTAGKAALAGFDEGLWAPLPL